MALPLGSCDPREDEHETCDDNRKAAGSRLVFRLHSLPHLSKLEWRSCQCCIFTWWNLGAQFIAQKLVSGASQDCICYLDACIVYLKTAVDNYRGGRWEGLCNRNFKRNQLGVSWEHRPCELLCPLVPMAGISHSLTFFKQINASGKEYSRKEIDLILSELFFIGFLGIHFSGKTLFRWKVPFLILFFVKWIQVKKNLHYHVSNSFSSKLGWAEVYNNTATWEPFSLGRENKIFSYL